MSMESFLPDLGQAGPCTPPFFNFGALTSDECIRCFCFGQTVQCFSSELQVSRVRNYKGSISIIDKHVCSNNADPDQTAPEGVV